MKKALTMVIIGFLCFSAFSMFSPSVHASVTVMPTRLPSARSFAAAVWDGSDAYVFGGGTFSGPLDQILKYNPTSDTISTMSATLPDPVCDMPAVWTGSYVYLFGGYVAPLHTSDKIVRYDPSTDTVTVMNAKLPTYAFPLYSMAAIWDGNYAYLFGGYDGYSYFDHILQYDPVQDQLTTMNARLPTGIKWMSAVWSGQYAYIFGGRTPSGVSNQIVRYDPIADSITVASATLPKAVIATSAVWTGSYVYIFGGRTMENIDSSDIFKYDPVLDSCSLVAESLPSPRAETSAVWDGSSAYIFGGSLAASVQIYDEIVRFSPEAQPNFEISASPTSEILLHVGGWNDSVSLILKSINGFSGSIQLSYSGPPEANIQIKFTQETIYLDAGSQITVGMNATSVPAALGEYDFIVVAKSGQILHEVSLTIRLVGNSAAIKNLVHLQQIPRSDPPFTIQQNFLVAAPNGTILYWVQNIVQINREVPLLSRRVIFSVFDIYVGPDMHWPDPILRLRLRLFMVGAMANCKWVSFPIDLNLTSHIEGNSLVLENNASSNYNVFSLDLPQGSYIVGYTGSYYHNGALIYWHQSPEIFIVGTSVSTTAYFIQGTSGFVKCYTRLVDEPIWRQTQNTILKISDPQTAEKSRNLKWLADGTFQYLNGSTDQGITFSPNYH